jgi:hypothetical protein
MKLRDKYLIALRDAGYPWVNQWSWQLYLESHFEARGTGNRRKITEQVLIGYMTFRDAQVKAGTENKEVIAARAMLLRERERQRETALNRMRTTARWRHNTGNMKMPPPPPNKKREGE